MARAAAAHVFVDDLERPSLGADDRHHLARVLRLRAGETVSTVDGRGRWRRCTYVAGGALEPAGDVEQPVEARPELTIGLTLTKGDRPEWAVQKLTEIGVDRVALLVSDRSVVRWDGERVDRHLHRFREVARQAAMQSRRLRLPVIEAPARVAEVLGHDRTAGGEHRGGIALAAPGGEPLTLALPSVLVGPEGGWSAAELELAPAVVDLGRSVLRTETAAVVAASVLSALRHRLVYPARQ